MSIDTSYAGYAAGAYKANATYQTTQAKFSVSASYLEIMGGTSGKSSKVDGDGIDLSDQVQEMLDRIRDLDAFKVIFPNSDPRQKTKSLGEVKNDFMADFNDFSGAFGKMSSMMGLDATQSFTMGLTGMGGMTVNGSDSSAAAKVAGAFNNNPAAVSRFAVMAARGSLADAGDTIPGFKEAYAEDPIQAIKDNIDALKERLLGFRAEASGGSMNYGFIREFTMDIEYSSTTVAYAKASEVTAGSQAKVEQE